MRLPAETVRSHAHFLSTMGNEKRLLVLLLLLEGELAVGELAKEVNLGQSALSQHLRRLHIEGLVSRRRVGQNVFYSTTSEHVRCIADAIRNLSFTLPYAIPQHEGANAERRAKIIAQMLEFSTE